MHRIDSVTAREDVNGIGKKGFSDNVDLPQHDATYVTPEWCNAIQEEIANAIEMSGIELDKNNNTQLAQAVVGLVKPLVQAIYHVGSWHGSDDLNYDPAVALEPLFGYLTKWALRPFVPNGVFNMTSAVKQLVSVAAGTDAKLSTTRIWQRMPDDWVPPTILFKNKNDRTPEGVHSRMINRSALFQIITTGIEAGTIFNWELLPPIFPNGIPADVRNEDGGPLTASDLEVKLHANPDAFSPKIPSTGTIGINSSGIGHLALHPGLVEKAHNNSYYHFIPYLLRVRLIETGDIAQVRVYPTIGGFHASLHVSSAGYYGLRLYRDGPSYPFSVQITGGSQYLVPIPVTEVYSTLDPTDVLTLQLSPAYLSPSNPLPANATIAVTLTCNMGWNGPIVQNAVLNINPV